MSVRPRLDTEPGGSRMEWPAAVFCAMFLGFTIAATSGSVASIVNAADRWQQQFGWHNGRAEPEVQQALIVTANRSDQLTVVATLSPRGFAPLLAGSGREVLAQIRAHPGTLRLAVVDATLPDYALIAHALKSILPVDSIIVLKGSKGPQDIGPMLLDRLGGLEKGNPRARHGSARGSFKPAVAGARTHAGMAAPADGCAGSRQFGGQRRPG